MKIADIYETYKVKYTNTLILIKKGIFRITLEEDAFFMAKYFSIKITPLDKSHIKVGFPDSSLHTWTKKLIEKGLGYVLISKLGGKEYDIQEQIPGNHFSSLYSINIEDFVLTKQRILGLATLQLQEKQTENFLLKDKLEDIHMLLSQWLMKLPRKERQYFREKIETLFMDTLEHIYMYMYNLGERKVHIESVYEKILVIREFTRFLYKSSRSMKDPFYLDIGERRIECLKITKTIRNKYTI